MSHEAIHAALAGPLAGQGRPVAWENVPYQPSIGTAWLRETFAPARAVAASVGADGRNRVGGLYTIDVFAPAGRGRADAETIAGEVMAMYPSGSSLTHDSSTVVIERSYRERATAEPDWFHVPVVVEFRADIAR